jgi:hypothetical protein
MKVSICRCGGTVAGRCNQAGARRCQGGFAGWCDRTFACRCEPAHACRCKRSDVRRCELPMRGPAPLSVLISRDERLGGCLAERSHSRHSGQRQGQKQEAAQGITRGPARRAAARSHPSAFRRAGSFAARRRGFAALARSRRSAARGGGSEIPARSQVASDSHRTEAQVRTRTVTVDRLKQLFDTIVSIP